MERRVTLADVALMASVSAATVSYVLNNKPGQSIPAETRQRVQAAAAELGYTRSGAARTLARGRSDIVLLLVPDLPLGSVLIGVLERLTEACARVGLQLLARFAPPEEHLGALSRELMPAAVVVLVDTDAQNIEQVHALGIPVTRWNAASTRGATSSPGDISVPTDALGWLQAETLAQGGHSRLGFVFPSDPRLHALAMGRLAGVSAYCREHELSLPVVAETGSDGPPPHDVRTWIADGITGLCVYNDDLALAVLSAARRGGVDVPGALALIGADDIPAGRFADPPLTTIAFELDSVCARIMGTISKDLGLAGPQLELAGGRELAVRRRGTVGVRVS